MTRCGAFSHTERGFVMMLVSIMVLIFALMIGFAVDLGSWYLSAAKLQRASDAAALSAAGHLPDVVAAQTAATDAYRKNGFVNGQNGVVMNTTITSTTVTTSVQNNSVPTYFLKLVVPNIKIGRVSQSQSPGLAPILGSPFNVLGTGDLTLPGLPGRQNFWLAVNGICSPKEDGDYFTSVYDKNKGPFQTGSYLPGGYNYTPAPTAKTSCPVPTSGSTPPKNADFDPSGYSYFISVPKPPTSSGTVDVKIYDPSFWDANVDSEDYPDLTRSMPKDSTYALGDIAFNLFDTNGTPDDYRDDTPLLPPGSGAPYAIDTEDSRTPHRAWWKLATIPSSRIASNGGEFRVQVFPRQLYAQTVGGNEGEFRGVNSFSIGAFPSWLAGGGVHVCDSRTNVQCPHVYGRNAISIFNHVSNLSAGSNADFYFAQIDPALAGQTFKVMFWDPGEGVTKLQVLAPNGTPMSFTYSSSDGGPTSVSPVTAVDTGGIDGTSRPGLSNAYVFNDRLLTLNLTIPSNYGTLVNGNDHWLRVRYTVNNAPDDRTTWGLAASASSGAGSPPHLTRGTS